METSLRYGVESKSLKIHAKEKIPLDSFTHLQFHGELDTKTGAPSYLSAALRHFYQDLSVYLGVGMEYDRREKRRYNVRAKKAFPVTTDGFLNFHVKGRCDTDQEFKQRKPKGSAEFSWDIVNFKKDQEVRIKVGYEIFEKVPYLQIRENNWTLNADATGRWNVKYAL
ncbi:PREDICTED: outer envelope pore protein 21B, chloroplastic-like [Ipomoea nil]|uniref:outer envelope pore protein 21B, chloroplastic-like n=1 Tax=Ipomoea nil TaxID=35883 RepID=UPI000901A614|nr:PREDICTED: outer envelope pore protein 21B, chloroplastic-like [Ipomoea nil]